MDPSKVLNSVVDDFAKQIQVGSQMDVVEYLLNFIERLEEGLGEDKLKDANNSNSSTKVNKKHQSSLGE